MGGATGDGTTDDPPTAYRLLADAVDDGLFVVGSSGRLSAVNDAFAELTGRSRTSLCGADLESVVESPSDQRLRNRCRSLAPDETAVLDATVSTAADGGGGESVPCSLELSTDGDSVVVVVCSRRSSPSDERTHLERREATLRETHEVIADCELSFDEQIDALLEIGQRVTGTAYATLARVRDDDYVFESVISPANDIEAGDVVPMSTRVCERTAAREESLVLEDIAAEAPELADRGSNERLEVNCYLGAPIFVDDDVQGLFCFYGPEAGADGFSEWEVTFVDLVSRWIGTELERQRRTERLAAVNELDAVVREVSDAVIDQSTRQEIETTACRRLAESDSYAFALLGEADTESSGLAIRSAVGIDATADEGSLSTPAGGLEPADAAIHSRELRTVHDVRGDALLEPWLPMADDDLRTVAAVPVGYEESLYGVLVIGTRRLDGFESEERAVLEHLGELVGHAIAAAERKRALMSDDVTELEFRASGYDPAPDSGSVRFERSIPLGDGEFLVYGTVDADAVDALDALADTRESWTELEVFGDDGDERSFELELSEPTLLSSMASIGASVRRVVFEDGDLRVTVRTPRGTDVRRVVDTVQDAFPTAEPIARRQVKRASRSAPTTRSVTDALTDRQRAALEAAYYAGFFEWPREHSGESVADSLGISPPTFHQHIRAAENKVVGSLLDERE